MTPEMQADLLAIAPEVWLAIGVVAALLADLVGGRRAGFAPGLVALLCTAGALFALRDAPAEPLRAFGMLALDGYAHFFRTLIISATGLVVLHAMVFRPLGQRMRNEFHPLALAAALGGCLLVSSDHLLMLLLAMELLSLPSYLMAGWQKNDRRSSEAALKYLVYGALATGLMAFGFSLLYGISGSLRLPEIALAVTQQWDLGGELGRGIVAVSTVLVFAGFFFKISAFPFHFWAPDVYEGSPTPLTTLLAVASKAAGFGLLVRFVDGVFLDQVVSEDWLGRFGVVIAAVSAVTMTYGNITAVRQTNVKRLLAYSSIAHAGYLLMGVAVMTVSLAAAGGAGEESRRQLSGIGMDALLFYLATYYVATLGAFGCVMALTNRFGAEDLDEYRGLGWKAPWIAGFFVVFLLSLTGLPPTVGFAGKWMLITASFGNGLAWLAVVAVLNSVVSLFYYFKIAKSLLLAGGEEEAHVEHAAVPVVAAAVEHAHGHDEHAGHGAHDPHSGHGHAAPPSVDMGAAIARLFPALAHASLLVLAAATLYLGLFWDDLSVWVERALR